MVDRAATPANPTETPPIAGAVRGYEAAGVAAIQREDQETPKKCRHTPRRRVVSCEDMVLKIEVAREARRGGDTPIVARTDARANHGIDEAIRRGRGYAKTCAEIVVVESPESDAEPRQRDVEIDRPPLANMVERGRTPTGPAARLKDWGFDLAICPGLGFQAAAAEAMRLTWTHLNDSGTSDGVPAPVHRGGDGVANIHEPRGFPDIRAFEKRWARD